VKENSIEENIKKIENLIECFRKAEIVELKDIESIYQKCSYSDYKAIDHILSDYKRVLKENEEYYKQLDLDYTENNFISKQIVKDNLIKYQEEYELLLEHQSGKESNRTKYLRGRIHMCQELLESEE